MVSAESFASGQGVPALRFLTDFAVGCRPLDCLLIDIAAVQVERLVAAARAECLPLIACRLR
jgi:hypothetical protein